MTATRNVNKTGPITGQTHVDTVADTLNELSKYAAGNAISPTGTNALSFTIGLMTGLTGIPDGLELDIIHPNSNTGAMTLEITGTGTGAKAARKPDGTAFVGGEIVGGTSYKWKFWDSEDHWRLVGTVRTSDSGAKYPLIYTKSITATGAWSFTAPWDCDVCLDIFGGGGGGRDGPGGSNRSGGGGAGHSKKFFSLSSGDIISGTIGSGGAINSAGGSTTATSSDIALSMTASGGQGGVTSGSAAGGTATGGDENYTGGESTIGLGMGGGAVGLNATGNSNSGATGAVALAANSPISITPFAHGQIQAGNGSNASPGTSGTYGCGGGGGVTSSAGLGGDGFVVIQYSADKSA